MRDEDCIHIYGTDAVNSPLWNDMPCVNEVYLSVSLDETVCVTRAVYPCESAVNRPYPLIATIARQCSHSGPS